jgi:hypothetical protein
MHDIECLKRATRYCCDRNFRPRFVVLTFLLCIAGLAVSCGTGAQKTNSANAVNSDAIGLSLTPDSATIGSLQQLQFTARISGTPNTAVTWSASAGTISSSGVFTAPKVDANTPVVITATSAHSMSADMPTVGASAHASATVTVTPPDSLAITTSTLPPADASAPYTASLTASGGIAPYHWRVATGSLPSGFQLQNSSGVVTGITALTGSYPVTTEVTDASGHSASAAFILTVSSTVSPSSTSGFDGPAELPRIYIQSAMANTPAPGSITAVNSGGDLQSALNGANCGDTIQLQAGATFSGAFTFPGKSCDDNHWIIVRTNADDSSLPAEGSRLTPCYAGLPSLPARPVLQCASTKNVVAKLVLTGSSNGPILFAPGANHYRLIGLEVTRGEGTGTVTALASVANNGTASNIIFDRVWMHGTAQDETIRGVWLGGGTYVSIVDSFFTDFHCIALTGNCTDAQAIAGGIGNDPMGPYKIVNNFLEASGENILFGGGSATLTPSDIQISRNHMFKPLAWMRGQAGYVGASNGNPFIVKNLLELKNAQRVLVEGNILEDSWGGFSQVGFAILITPKNQAGNKGSNLCSICQVTDVTIRNSSISHVGAGIQIGNALSDKGGVSLDGQRYSIHDIVIDDIDGTKYNGPGEFAQMSVSPGAPLLQNVAINHVTAFPSHMLFVIGDMVATSGRMKNFVFTNSIVNAGGWPVWSTGGGQANCAFDDSPLTTFNTCFASSTFVANVIIASPPDQPSSKWPSGNFFATSAGMVQFVNYNAGNGGDYRLQPSSPYKGKSTDNKDLGADVDAIASAIAGVE